MHVAVRDGAIESIRLRPTPSSNSAANRRRYRPGFPRIACRRGPSGSSRTRGPFCVDWNVGPASAAERPAASLLQFDHDGIPIAQDAEPLDRTAAPARAQAQLEFFWAMAPIAAKYAGRDGPHAPCSSSTCRGGPTSASRARRAGHPRSTISTSRIEGWSPSLMPAAAPRYGDRSVSRARRRPAVLPSRGRPRPVSAGVGRERESRRDRGSRATLRAGRGLGGRRRLVRGSGFAPLDRQRVASIGVAPAVDAAP